MGQDARRLAEPDGAAGAMVENIVLMELTRRLTWSNVRAQQTLPFGDRLRAMPVEALWRLGA